MGIVTVFVALTSTLLLTLLARKELRIRLAALEAHHEARPWLRIQEELGIYTSLMPVTNCSSIMRRQA